MSELSTTDSPSAAGLALVVGTPERRRQAVATLEASGAIAVEVDDPYLAMAELSREPAGFSSIVLSLHGVYREELQIIAAIRNRFPHIDVWLTDLDGRSSALAEAMRLGADGLLGEEGMHRLAVRAKREPDVAVEPAISRVTPARPHEVNGHAPSRVETAVIDRARHEADRESPAFEPRRIAPDRGGHETPREPNGSAAGSAARGDGASLAGSPLGFKDAAAAGASPPADDFYDPYSFAPGEPILTAEELRALLHDQPDTAPTGRDE
ncbi:hypothetical protein [Humisphaera borealis]|uniref:Uncharacterized protein n=1 Tax=Humisphaera borealis TaxID=2807512 RepID=A0A7M2WUR7_9BACT|nr:hypothetical protein [Humisphaera borealis]QOV88922.1 hypothetical protein IPV69_22260 [Humisphaera borealis]